jgi:hypothetical protein
VSDIEERVALSWAETIAWHGSGPTRTIDIDVYLPGVEEPVPVEVPLGQARVLHAMLGDAISDGVLPEEDGDEPGLPAEPDSGLSTGAAFLVNAIHNARVSELQAAFRALGWGPIRFVLVLDSGPAAGTETDGQAARLALARQYLEATADSCRVQARTVAQDVLRILDGKENDGD